MAWIRRYDYHCGGRIRTCYTISMKITVTNVINGYDGKPIEGSDGTPLTMRNALLTALNTLAVQEHQSADEKAKIYALSVKISAHDPVELNLDERALLKARAGIILRPVIFGPVSAALEDPGEDKPTK